MTNGISVNDTVQVKATGEIGRVVAIDDHTDSLPADLQIELGRVEVSRDFNPLEKSCFTKLRVDEVKLWIDCQNW